MRYIILLIAILNAISCSQNRTQRLDEDGYQLFPSVNLATSIDCSFVRDTVADRGYNKGNDSNALKTWVCPPLDSYSPRSWNPLRTNISYEIKAYQNYSHDSDFDYMANMKQMLYDKGVSDWWEVPWQGFAALSYRVPHKPLVETWVYNGAFNYYFSTYAMEDTLSKHQKFLSSIELIEKLGE